MNKLFILVILLAISFINCSSREIVNPYDEINNELNKLNSNEYDDYKYITYKSRQNNFIIAIPKNFKPIDYSNELFYDSNSNGFALVVEANVPVYTDPRNLLYEVDRLPLSRRIGIKYRIEKNEYINGKDGRWVLISLNDVKEGISGWIHDSNIAYKQSFKQNTINLRDYKSTLYPVGDAGYTFIFSSPKRFIRTTYIATKYCDKPPCKKNEEGELYSYKNILFPRVQPDKEANIYITFLIITKDRRIITEFHIANNSNDEEYWRH